MLASLASGLQLPECTATAGCRSRQHRQTQRPIDERERPRGANPSAEEASSPVAQIRGSLWECPRRAASAPPPALAPGFWVPGPQGGESAAGGRVERGCRWCCRRRRHRRLAPGHVVEPRARVLQLRQAPGQLGRGVGAGRPRRPERLGLGASGVSSRRASVYLAG